MEEDEFKLNDRQRLFCHAYVRTLNRTKAAKEAGYSEDTAYSIGSENLSKPEIKAYIDYLQKDLSKATGITGAMIADELRKIAFSSIAHLHNTWIERKEFEMLTDDQKSAIESIDTKVEKMKPNGDEPGGYMHYVKIKLYSKVAALQELNKMLGTNAPQQVVNTNININSEPLSRDELKKAADELDNEL